LISHEATQTGAPVLSLSIARRLSAKYNVISLLLKGGELEEEFERVSAKVVCMKEGQTHPVDLKFVLQSINRQHPICQGIVNSLAAANAVPALAQTGIPSILLIHEFYAQVESLFDVSSALYWASERVFSADIVRESYRAAFPHLRARTLPQGSCDPTAQSDDDQAKFLQQLMRPRALKDAFVVLGVGTVDMRKGVDLFIATATSVVRSNPQRSFRFVWIGEPGPNQVYRSYIDEQVNRSGIGDSLLFIPGGIDLKAAYSLADAFYLPSRLDPLPNVAIDAAMHGLPVICFDGATGIADVLKRDIAAGGTVLPYLDVAGAAQKIAEIADDPNLRAKVAGAMRELALKTFDMDQYVRSIDDIGVGAQATMRQLNEDFVTISENSLFDNGVTPAAKRPPAESTAATQHFPSVWERPSIARDNAIMQFLARWSAAPEGAHRRPTPGFHPQIYAEHHPKLLETGTNPFADFLRKGCPPGPWFNQVIRPEVRVPPAAADLRVAIHAHFHYPELIDDFLAKLAANSSRYDLFLTTNDTAKAARLRGAIGDRGEIHVVPNKGRDIGPLLTAFGSELIDRYDVIGHLHAKRSIGVSPALPDLGDRWREFLWQHLIGDRHPMMDLLLEHFTRDEKVGLVFADDIHLCGWDADLAIAEELAARAGIKLPLDRYFNFPIGTMFWARSQALRPLVGLGLDWSDYPEEPVPIDGTVMHALERLVPFAARQAGFSYATVNVPGVTWD
jgi:glycosyltransferase involved in cell wall biosynthesis